MVMPVRFPAESRLAMAVAPVPPPPEIWTMGVSRKPEPVVVRPAALTPLPMGASKAFWMVVFWPWSSMVAPPP